ncbi:MAG: hypothetical protein U5P41_15900 [Gammaproteobacteria bacterium]|nr:hypothetical protein [Gammaproteobacteria bacterium]
MRHDPTKTQPIVVHASHWPFYLRQLLIGLLVLVVLLAGVAAAGLVRYEQQRGFFAPAWGPDGAVYFVEREARGLLIGIDWQTLDAPNWTWVWSDRVSIRRLHPDTGELRTLRTWTDTPVAGRFINAPRSSAFGVLLATLNTGAGLNFTVNISVPTDRAADDSELKRQQKLFTGRADNILSQMRELIAVPGDGFFPAAIVTTINNEDYEVLLQNNEFSRLYPDGIPATLLEDLSRREAVAMQARVVEKRNALIEGYQRQGLDRTEAVRRADADLAAEGYKVLQPRLIAMQIEEPEKGERVFSISADDFSDGYFSDIAAAIEQPGMPVSKADKPYKVDQTEAIALNEWLAGGAVSWVVETDGRYYRLLVRY